MNKKQLIFLTPILIAASLSFAEETSFNPFPQNKHSLYEYDNNNIPEICFFPVDKARWDGLKITAKEWIMLTDFQKTMFIAEYCNTHYPGIEINGWDYLVYLNKFAEKPGTVDASLIRIVCTSFFASSGLGMFR